MDASDVDLRKELDATLQARKELGPDYESALVESFVAKVEKQLAGTLDRQVRRQLAEQQMAAARGPAARSGAGQEAGDGSDYGADYGTGYGVSPGFGERFGFVVVSLILAIPLSAIGVVNAGFKGLVISWFGVVAVNAVHAARGWGLGRPKE
jgi:hypothetical protein